MVRTKGYWHEGFICEMETVIRKTISKYSVSSFPHHDIDDMTQDIFVKVLPIVQQQIELRKPKQDILNIVSAYTKRVIPAYYSQDVVLVPSFDTDNEDDETTQSFIRRYYREELLTHPYEFIDFDDETNEANTLQLSDIIKKIIEFTPSKYVSPKTLKIMKQMFIMYIIGLKQNLISEMTQQQYKNKNMFVINYMITLYNQNPDKIKLLYELSIEYTKLCDLNELINLIEKNITKSKNNSSYKWDGNTYRACLYLSELIENL